MESLTDTGLCLQDLVSGVATSSSATSGSSESSAAHNHHQHTNHHHHHAPGHDTVVPAVSAVSVSSAAAGIMSASSAVLGLNHHHHHHVSAAVPDSVGHHHVPCAPTVLHHEPLEKLKRGEYSCNSSVRFLENTSRASSHGAADPELLLSARFTVPCFSSFFKGSSSTLFHLIKTYLLSGHLTMLSLFRVAIQ